MRTWLGRTGVHLSEEDILRLLRPPSVPDLWEDRARAHLSRCESCAAEAAEIDRFLDRLSDTHDAAADGRVSMNRLAKQKYRILRRVRHLIEPGRRSRVLRFPAASRPTLAGVGRVGGWLSAAAFTGLLVGLAVGQWLHLHPDRPSVNSATGPERTMNRAPTIVIPRPELVNLPLAMSSTSEDGFLDELDEVLGSPPILELTPLDEITPRIRETAVYRW